MPVITDPSHLERLLDRQARLWNLRRQLAQEGGATARRELAHLDEGPWITLSMQLGAHGLDVAKRLEADLGWQVFDKEILAAIAERTHWRERLLRGMDERRARPLVDYVAHLIVPDHHGQPEFLRELLAVVVTLAQRGRAILLGRGLNWVLDPRYGLRARIVADRESRIETVARSEGTPRAEAARRVAEDDVRRAAFVRQVHRCDIEDPLGYDLVVNAGALGTEAAGEAILRALRSKLGAG